MTALIRSKRRTGGFTLLELMIVIIILGILASVAVPQFTRSVRKSRTAEAKATIALVRGAEMRYFNEFGTIDRLTLRIRYDDGFVSYLNGRQAASDNDPAVLSWDSAALAARDDGLAVVFEEFDITDHAALLATGENVLAIHGLNRTTASSDFLIAVELVAALR